MNGIFTISLDFELHWGVFDKRDRLARRACYRNTRRLVPTLLQTFERYGVHVTWATVGSLFVRNEDEWRRFVPAVKPSYANAHVSAYHYAETAGLATDEEAHFAPELVACIPQYEGQELGSHTFSHYYCMEPGQQLTEFEADLQAVHRAAGQLGVNIVSLVFPRNQFNRDYLQACWNNGIRVVRSNPKTWYWTGIADADTSLTRKLFRTGDAFLPLGKKTYPVHQIQRAAGEPLQLPASRLLRSYHPRYKTLNLLRLKRILTEMSTAAEKQECYHLWWHPENFGDYPEQNMRDLEVILEHYRKLKNRYGISSWNMGEYWENLA